MSPALRLPAGALCGMVLLAVPGSADTVVASRTIPARTVLAAEDLVLRPGVPGGSFDRVAAVAGLESRAILYAGRPILAAQVGPPTLVERNMLVRLVYRAGSVSIRTEGRALGRAGAGEAVQVLNQRSRVTVAGIVTGPGEVQVTGPGAHP
jgi:flagella basal body P-ring formation protein FlgA